MKIQGRELKGPNFELIVIPRGDDQPIVFKAQAVLDYDEFNKLCPEPEAPMIIRPGKSPERDFADKNYQAAMRERTRKQTYFMFIKSLAATEGLEWDVVDINKPDTWLQFEDELKNAGLSQVERNVVTRGCMIANCLDEAKVEEARKRFIQSQAEPASTV